MIDLKKRPTPGPSSAAISRVLREFGPWIAKLIPKPGVNLDATGIDDLDDGLRRDIGLPPKQTRQRPFPDRFKPPPFF
ncbi:MAG: hypothetical protein AAFR34_02060 [Pseudomonadota bacterium]